MINNARLADNAKGSGTIEISFLLPPVSLPFPSLSLPAVLAVSREDTRRSRRGDRTYIHLLKDRRFLSRLRFSPLSRRDTIHALDHQGRPVAGPLCCHSLVKDDGHRTDVIPREDNDTGARARGDAGGKLEIVARRRIRCAGRFFHRQHRDDLSRFIQPGSLSMTVVVAQLVSPVRREISCFRSSRPITFNVTVGRVLAVTYAPRWSESALRNSCTLREKKNDSSN